MDQYSDKYSVHSHHQSLSPDQLQQPLTDDRTYINLEDLKPHHLSEMTGDGPSPIDESSPMDQTHQQHNNQHQSSSHHLLLHSQPQQAAYHQHSVALAPVDSMCLQLPSFNYQLSDGTLQATGGSNYCDLNDSCNPNVHAHACMSDELMPSSAVKNLLPQLSGGGVGGQIMVNTEHHMSVVDEHQQFRQHNSLGQQSYHTQPPQQMRPPSSSPNCAAIASRKRKSVHTTEASDFDDETSDEKTVRTTDDNKKQNHSEIEKRRRDKMNTYITELSAIIPLKNSSMPRKLDKLTVLRMAVQHLKAIRGSVHSFSEGHYKPAFLSDQELKMLIMQAADGFLFVVGCDRGRILYVSESVAQVLNYKPADLLSQSWFDIVHPKDIAKVKEQLSSSDLNPRDRLIDAKTMLPVRTDEPPGLARLCPGARRSFFCRMKSKPTASIKVEAADMGTPGSGGSSNNSVTQPQSSTSTSQATPVQPTNSCSSTSRQRRKTSPSGAAASDRKYTVIQCTGYLKSWAPSVIGADESDMDADGDLSNVSCLVAIGRIPPDIYENMDDPQPMKNAVKILPIQFMSRHTIDGKFMYVDQSATLILGFLPQELQGTSMYEYYHQDDIATLTETHKTLLQPPYRLTTADYHFRSKERGFVRLQSEWKAFINPWTKEIEFLVAKNSLLMNRQQQQPSTVETMRMESDVADQPPPSASNFDFFNQADSRDIHRLINAGRTGQQVADQARDIQRRVEHRSSSDDSPRAADDRSSANTLHPHHLQLSSGDNSASGGELTAGRFIASPQSQYQQPPQRIGGVGGGGGASAMSVGFNATTAGGSSESLHIMGGGAVGHNADAQSYSDANDAGGAGVDGHDEVAMAAIMSLLEADAGLGGQVDYTGLQWPLP